MRGFRWNLDLSGDNQQNVGEGSGLCSVLKRQRLEPSLTDNLRKISDLERRDNKSDQDLLQLKTAAGLDAVMCALINGIQWQLRYLVCSPEELDVYLSACEPVSRGLFYEVFEKPDVLQDGNFLQWQSPVKTAFPENDTARARVFLSPSGLRSPTVIFLHALMSASDIGYRRIAARLNRRGWNAVLMHLPYHYSRVPRGHFNGALALTANLPQNAETLRQAVIEVRQLMNFFRVNGCQDFGVIGTSYGGWVGALVSFLERDFRFVTLLQPIADVEHAIWESPASFNDQKGFAGGRNRARCVEKARASDLALRWPTCL